VIVSPRTLAGDVLPSATVTASLLGPGTLTGPTARGDGTFEVRVVAPTSPGSAVLTLSVNGVAAGVRPRFFWD
jgi:hypothetical protein